MLSCVVTVSDTNVAHPSLFKIEICNPSSYKTIQNLSVFIQCSVDPLIV